jgi:hypothetical protein
MAMLRSVPSIIVAFGVLVMSLPGGSCFLWAELGAEHHHHGKIEQGKAPASCFHEHDCDDKLNKNPVDSVAVLVLGHASESIESPLKSKGKVTLSGTHKDSTLKVCDKAKSCTY